MTIHPAAKRACEDNLAHKYRPIGIRAVAAAKEAAGNNRVQAHIMRAELAARLSDPS